MKASGIGGQAVMEGVMMKNGDEYAVAVRKNDEEIVVEKQSHVSLTKRVKFFGLPVIRGVIIFGESLFVGVKTLTYSARIYEEETGEADKPMTAKDKTKEDIIMAGSVVLSIILAVGLFMLLPFFAATLIKDVVKSEFLQALIEGIIRVTLFVLYIAAISFMKDIKRVFMYHGAEHKSINCIENGLELTVENVKAQSREHKRCGTSFMLYVMVLSVLFFMVIRVDNFWLRIVFRLLLIPVIAGVSYEFIKFAGRTTNPVINALSKPGLLLQKLTTREPDESMIEVAITSVEAVFDWKEFLEKYDEKDSACCDKEEPKAAPEEKKEKKDVQVNKPHGSKSKKNKRNKHKHEIEEPIEAEVVANVRIGGITDPIEDLDDDFDIIASDPSRSKAKAAGAEAEAAEDAAGAEAEVTEAAETVEEAGMTEAVEAAEAVEEAESKSEAASVADEAEAVEDVAGTKTEAAEEATGAETEAAEETAGAETGAIEEKAEEAEKTETNAEANEASEESAGSGKAGNPEDSDNLGYFRGRRSAGKRNTGMDSAPEATKGINHRAPVEIEKRAVIIEDDEDDEVLKKLDRYFVNKNKKDNTQ